MPSLWTSYMEAPAANSACILPPLSQFMAGDEGQKRRRRSNFTAGVTRLSAMSCIFQEEGEVTSGLKWVGSKQPRKKVLHRVHNKSVGVW